MDGFMVKTLKLICCFFIIIKCGLYFSAYMKHGNMTFKDNPANFQQTYSKYT